jgi:Flp pilus assembly pilin Flp
MKNFLVRFWREEEGQDLIEYTLLMAFIALASASLFVSAGGSISGIWSSGSSTLANAASGVAAS